MGDCAGVRAFQAREMVLIYSGGCAEYRLPPASILEAFSLGKLNLNTDNPRSNPLRFLNPAVPQ
jgi:hypothetical protein